MLPWAAWNGDRELHLSIGPGWQVKPFPMADAIALTDDEVVAAIEEPVGTKNLAGLVADKTRIVIAVDDLSRPTPTQLLLEVLLTELDYAGVPADAITVIVSLGTHTELGKAQLYKKLGREIVDNLRVINHDCCENLAPAGVMVGKMEVLLNKEFLEADFRILIGSVVPHHFAGFSGGAKMVLPGLSNLDSIVWTHKAVMMGLRSKPGTLENNRFRAEFERIARHVGIDFCLNVVVNSQRQVAGFFAGDLIEAHSKAAKFAKEIYATEAAENLDVAIFNAYPKDTELLQSENAFMYMHTVGEKLVRENGTIVITAACSEGLGKHGLFEPGSGVLYRKPMPKRFLKNRNVLFFVPGVSEEEFYQIYWEGYHYAKNWETVVDKINKWHPGGCEVGVFPHASIQINV